MRLQGVELVSFIPGRVRLRVDVLKGNPALGTRAERELGAAPGIKSVDVSPTTGSLLLVYDRKAVKDPAAVNQLFDTLHALFPTVNLASMRDWLLSKA